MASAYCALWTVFPKAISGLRKPIAIHAAVSFNKSWPECPLYLAFPAAGATPARRSFVISRISSGGALSGRRFRYIDSQCPLVTSRNIAELQHVATTRRVGESGLSRCSSRYSCPITHCTRSFRYRIKPDPLSGSSTDGAEASSSNRRPASWQLVQKQEPVRIGGPTASNFTLPHWHIAERCLCCFWFTATSHSWITFKRLFWQWCEMSATGSFSDVEPAKSGLIQ